ncbi:hypothetical protein M501DRAFT_1030548 [Patellaria atrata CBS 101060]|uniref:Uncharacterized protein n=1 Tax=Patellaria atrata CBS 101060 TaxID=1346257 RepID=A0A9P4SCS3_9PEZI|nr:hypothetical protein M501DRAFT_1030548 [Patellaria atrata CBS 101060]
MPHNLGPFTTSSRITNPQSDSESSGGQSSASTGSDVRRVNFNKYLIDPNEPSEEPEWTFAIEKGRSLHHGMAYTMKQLGDAYQSHSGCGLSPQVYFAYSDIEKWGYNSVNYEGFIHDPEDQFKDKGIERAVSSLGLSTEDPRDDPTTQYNRAMVWEHNRTTEHDNQKYHATEGYFYNVYNVRQGAIYALDLKSPQSVVLAGTQPVTIPLPPLLHHWSDITFTTYEQLAKEAGMPLNQLKYVLTHGIMNKCTKRIIKRILRNRGMGLDDAPDWPGIYLEHAGAANVETAAASDEFYAVLGTELGSGPCWLAINHKERLGIKCIKEINIWMSVCGNMNILFKYKDVEEPTQG